jgi:hypothetical protein
MTKASSSAKEAAGTTNVSSGGLHQQATVAAICQMDNLAIPCCYLVVGLVQGLTSPLINV